MKDLSGLKYTAPGDMEVCFTCEKILRKKNVSLKVSENLLMNVIDSNTISDVLQHFIGKPIFYSLKDHALEHDHIHNHTIQYIVKIFL